MQLGAAVNDRFSTRNRRDLVKEILMANTETAVALAPSSDNRIVSIDRTVHAPPVNLAGAVGELMQNVKGALGNMQADDVSIEVDAHSDAERSSARVRFRAYRHRAPRDDASA